MADTLTLKPVGADSPDSTLDIRVLDPNEVESLRPIFNEQKALFPNERTSFFVGAVDENGKVVAFLCFQLQLHAEPMWIDHGYESIFRRLVQVGEQTLLDKVGPCLIYTFTPAGKITKLAQAAGMQMEPWVVMSKIVGTEEKVQ